MGECDNVPEEYCGFMLEPKGVYTNRNSGDWHEEVRNACCLREPKYDGLCIWHANVDKEAAELVGDRLKPGDLKDEGLHPAGDSWEARHVRENINGTILQDIEFPDKFSFDGCVLAGAEFNGISMHRGLFLETDLCEAEFQDADLKWAKFRETDLRGVNFIDVDLRQAEFQKTNLRWAKFRETDLRNADFLTVNLWVTEFWKTNLRMAEFRMADFRWAEFRQADLRRAKFPFEDEYLIRANSVYGTSLEDAQFEERTDLRGTNLSGAQFYQTLFTDVRINDNTTFGLEDGSGYGEKCRYEYDLHTSVPTSEDMNRLEAAAWSYRRLESIFEENAMDDRARTAHIRKEEVQRKHQFIGVSKPFIRVLPDRLHKRLPQRFKNTDPPEDSWLKSFGQFAVSTFNWRLHRHGESLRQLLGASAILILVCGLLYVVPSSGVARNNPGTMYRIANFAEFTRPEAYIDLLIGLYFSIITFSTIGYGDFYPASPVSRLLVGFESLAGALLIALFVFVIGRRVAR